LTIASAGSGSWSTIGTRSSPPRSTRSSPPRAIEVLTTPVRAPRANAYAERWIGTVRREVLDRMLVFGGRQLQAVLAEYVDHGNGYRPHRALGQAPPLGPTEPPVVLTTRTILRRDRLGR
jgi:putative transposase